MFNNSLCFYLTPSLLYHRRQHDYLGRYIVIEKLLLPTIFVNTSVVYTVYTYIFIHVEITFAL